MTSSKQKQQVEQSTIICCENPSIIYDTDDYVCRNCGTCHQYIIPDNDEYRYCMLSDRYLHTESSSLLGKVANGKRLIFERRVGRVTFQDANLIINRIVDDLALPANVLLKKRAMDIYKKLWKKGVFKHRKFVPAILGACIYYIIKESNLPRSITDVEKCIASNEMFKKHLSDKRNNSIYKHWVARYYHDILDNLGSAQDIPQIIDSVIAMTNKIGKSLGMKELDIRRAIAFLQFTKETPMYDDPNFTLYDFYFQGKNTVGIICAILYFVGNKPEQMIGRRKSLSQFRISEVCNITGLTIRNSSLVLANMLEREKQRNKYQQHDALRDLGRAIECRRLQMDLIMEKRIHTQAIKRRQWTVADNNNSKKDNNNKNVDGKELHQHTYI